MTPAQYRALYDALTLGTSANDAAAILRGLNLLLPADEAAKLDAAVLASAMDACEAIA